MRALIIDGYNVIHSVSRYAATAEEDLDAARARLVSDVAAFAQGEYRAYVVFDGGSNPASDGAPHHISGVVVMFSPFGTEADSVIEALAARCRENGSETVVVTSDQTTQWTVFGGSVSRMSSVQFASALEAGAQEWRDANPSGSPRGRLEDRVDASVREVLARWARGEH
ncbi:MAG: NYN domain-containing protein [Actinomycetota bacterium]|nr:NYN domain-containing protein [Actinomycetota bacterium]